jgi:hypothetical protein
VAEIEVASLDLGDQIQAEWLPLIGITYDPNDDVVEVALDRQVEPAGDRCPARESGKAARARTLAQ